MEKETSLTNLAGGRTYKYSNWDTTQGRIAMTEYLGLYTDIHAVFCQDDHVLFGVREAIDNVLQHYYAASSF